MQFVLKSAQHQLSGRRANVFFPDPHGFGEHTRANDTYTDIEVDGIPRVAHASVIKLVALFTAEREKRAALGHDSAVFALAHETGRSYSDVDFNREGGQKVVIGHATDLLVEGRVDEKDILLTSAAAVTPEHPEASTHPHFLVTATADDKELLYASKLGPDGDVVLSTFAQTARLYPVEAVMSVSGLRAANY
jgi:hypothetical protein